MKTSSVSFGKVVAVSGKQRKMRKMDKKLSEYMDSGLVMKKNVTEQYRYAFSDGLMAQAAQRGDEVSIYITGSDVDKINAGAPKWNTLSAILSNLQEYCDLREVSIKEAMNKMF